jgi:LmbE family N-acetylglucosaminyl deacetylase
VIKFGQSAAELYVPDGIDGQSALHRSTHLGVGAHQDDLEIMAFHGVMECFGSSDKWFCGVTCTNGVGGPRKEGLENLAPDEVGALRNEEQNKAADLGRYGAMVQLNYASSDVKGRDKSDLIADLYKILCAVRPAVVYTHNPADKHDTHVGVMIATLHAIRGMPADSRPKKLFGCEVWRDLDWLSDHEKVRLDASGNDELAAALINCHASQVTPAKRYDLATIGRRRANATYSDSHSNILEKNVTHAMDLSPLILDDTLNLQDFLAEKIHDFEQSVVNTLIKQLPG